MSVRPSTPNTVLEEDVLSKEPKVRNTFVSGGWNQVDVGMSSGPGSGGPPPAVIYTPPEDEAHVTMTSVSGVFPDGHNEEVLEESPMGETMEPMDTMDLLEKEFEDFYEDGVHKAAGPAIFCSKTLGMLPVIWTEEDEEGECKSYFNLYSFAIFLGWISLAVISALRLGSLDTFPGDQLHMATNASEPLRYLTNTSMDAFVTASWVAAIVALLFSVFKSRALAEFLFGLSEVDSQLELTSRHYDKLQRKTVYALLALLILLAIHAFAFVTLLKDADNVDLLLIVADVLAKATVFVLELQFYHCCINLCKRYRLVNKILTHITKPWKTLANADKPKDIVHHLLQKQFETVFEPDNDSVSKIKKDLARNVSTFDALFGPTEETSNPKSNSKEEEHTFILQLDVLRCIHGDLNALAMEVNNLWGVQIMVHIITSVVFFVLFGYFFIASLIEHQFYWPYLTIAIIPALRIFLIGHFGQELEIQSKQPFVTLCQISTLSGSPKLERQVQKTMIQMQHQCPRLTAAGYFTLGRNMILKTIGVAVVFTFFMCKFRQAHDLIISGSMDTKL